MTHSFDSDSQDEMFMQAALDLAEQAAAVGEVPVGAIVVLNDIIIGRGFNQPIQQHDPSAHAEIMALRCAAQEVGNYRLLGTTLYVTLEPCMMCAGAMIHARIQRLVFATAEPKAGAIISHPMLNKAWLNHSLEVTSGVGSSQAKHLLQNFFSQRRSNGNA